MHSTVSTSGMDEVGIANCAKDGKIPRLHLHPEITDNVKKAISGLCVWEGEGGVGRKFFRLRTKPLRQVFYFGYGIPILQLFFNVHVLKNFETSLLSPLQIVFSRAAADSVRQLKII